MAFIPACPTLTHCLLTVTQCYRCRSSTVCTRRSFERECLCRRCPLRLWDLDTTTGDETSFDLLRLLAVHSGDALGDWCLDGDGALAGFFDRRMSFDDGEDFLISEDDVCLANSRLSVPRSLSWRERLSAVVLLLFSGRRATTVTGLRLKLLLLQKHQKIHFLLHSRGQWPYVGCALVQHCK